MKKLLIIALVPMILACSKDDNSGGSRNIKYIDITNAVAVYTTANGNSGARSSGGSDESRLFKVTTGGSNVPVRVEDAAGREVVMSNARVNQANDEMLHLGFSSSGQYYEFYIRNRDGAVFEIPQQFHGQYYFPFFPIYDKMQNIYVMGHPGIYKVYEENDGIVATKISKDYSVNYHSVDWNGNVYMGVGGTDRMFCVTANGESFLSDVGYAGITLRKKEGVGLIFSRNGNIVEYSIDSQAKQIVENVLNDSGSAHLDGDTRFLFHVNDCTVLPGHEIIIIRSPQDITYFPSENLFDVFHVASYCTNNYFYWEKSNVIYRMSLESGIEETLLSGTAYQLYDYPNSGRQNARMFVTDDDVVYFYGLNINSGTKVYGKIENGTITEEPESSGQSVISFVRIN